MRFLAATLVAALGQSPAPVGGPRLVPLPPVVARTKVVYAWRVVGYRLGSMSSKDDTTTLSRGGRNGMDLTDPTYEVVVETKPHGNGSMSVTISGGLRRPPMPGVPSLGASGMTIDGYDEAPAVSFVHPLVTKSMPLSLPAKLELARVLVPEGHFGDVVATRMEGASFHDAYRKTVPLDKMRMVPYAEMTTPRLKALAKEGYNVHGEVNGPTIQQAFRLVVAP